MQNLKYIEEWLQHSHAGDYEKAQELYFSYLLPEVIEKFSRENDNLLEEELLISVLGFSPEPIILTAKAMNPKHHVILTTDNKSDSEAKIEEFLNGNYTIIRTNDISFNTMYKILKEQLLIFGSSRVVIDITGGKKSMVASAAIFGKDHGCKIVYVDFDEYIKELRKPKPGSERLDIVYDPFRDQPEIFITK
jgi:hypothetical protein